MNILGGPKVSFDDINKIFENAISGSKIFRNKNVLYHDFIPESLPFRENQINRLAQIFSSLLKNEKGSNVFIYGKPGTGKTAVVKYVMSKFKNFIGKKGIDIFLSYVNCRTAGTEYRVLLSIAQDIGITIPFTGLSVEEALSRIIDKIKTENKPFLVVFDEIDVLVIRYGDKILYNLSRMGSNYAFIPHVIVGISNDLRFKEYLDPRVISSLSEEELIFKPYSATELEVIIKERVELAFRKNVVDPMAIKIAAALSASEHGDARKALDIIRVAGEIAEERNDNMVVEKHVREAYTRLDSERTFDVIRSLPLHSKLILISLLNVGDTSIQSSRLYGIYKGVCSQIGEQPLSYRRFHSLVSELAIMGIVSRRIYNYGRKGGRISSIKLLSSINDIVKALSDDPLLNDIIEI